MHPQSSDALFGAMLYHMITAAAHRTGPEALLLRLDPDAALLLLPDTQTLVVLMRLDEPGEPSIPMLNARLEAFLEESPGALFGPSHAFLHLALVGGEVPRAWLEATHMPRPEGRRRVVLHHVGPTGEVWTDPGAPLKAIDQAAAAVIAAGEPLHIPTDGELRQARRQSEQYFQDVAAFQKLTTAGLPRVTLGIGIAIGVLFGLELLWGGSTTATLSLMGGNIGPPVRAGEWWRVLASAFLHGGVMHAVMNGAVLAQLGPFLERILGGRRFLVLYTLSALGGGLASTFISSAGVTIGASGALWGLMCAGAVLAWRPRGVIPARVAGPLKQGLFRALAINLIFSFLPQVSMSGHLGGGITGAALLFTGLLLPRPDERGREERGSIRPMETSPLLTLAAGFSLLAMAASVAIALDEGRPWEISSPPALEALSVPGQHLSIELPEGLARHLEPSESLPGAVEIGRLGSDPMNAMVHVEPLSAPVAGGEVSSTLARLAAEAGFSEQAVAALRGSTEAQPVVFEDLSRNDYSVGLWAMLRDSRFIVVRTMLLPGLGPAWKDIPERVVRSVKLEGG